MVSQRADNSSGTERVPEVWSQQVPQRNINFTGREQLLAQLSMGLAKQVTAVLPHALYGLGGVGKTQVAIEYAWRYRADHDVVWWNGTNLGVAATDRWVANKCAYTDSRWRGGELRRPFAFPRGNGGVTYRRFIKRARRYREIKVQSGTADPAELRTH